MESLKKIRRKYKKDKVVTRFLDAIIGQMNYYHEQEKVVKRLRNMKKKGL